MRRCARGYPFVLLQAAGYRIAAALDPLDWEGKNPPPQSQRPGDSATMNRVKNAQMDTGKNTPVEVF